MDRRLEVRCVRNKTLSVVVKKMGVMVRTVIPHRRLKQEDREI